MHTPTPLFIRPSPIQHFPHTALRCPLPFPTLRERQRSASSTPQRQMEQVKTPKRSAPATASPDDLLNNSIMYSPVCTHTHTHFSQLPLLHTHTPTHPRASQERRSTALFTPTRSTDAPMKDSSRSSD